MRPKVIIIFVLALLFLGAPAAYAQISGAAAIDPVNFVITPEAPAPNQQVTVEAQGVGTFLGDAMITWQQNGKTVSSGIGQKVFSFTAGSLGMPTRVHVVINSSVQGTIARDFTFIPTTINLLWEADTTVPPFYRGKALYSAGSSFKVLALPQVVVSGATVSPSALSYQWSVNDTPVVDQSGKGRTVLQVDGNQLHTDEEISVAVYLNSSHIGDADITIPAVDPNLVLYVKDPLRGVLFDQALPSSVSLTGQEITLQAEPYYFSNDSKESGSLSYAWTLNGSSTSGPDSANGTLTLRQAGAGEGAASLGVQLQNMDSSRIVQAAQAALQIFFGGQTTSSGPTFGI
ncbi:MAG TPA: hypothetical protein VG934_01960 [Candidatus Paceibacterota bacterium]|nr:hypothetical protein [Candidatus Paceibacterota bacterium]